MLNISVTADFHGQVNASLVTSELRRIETKLTARLDVLEATMNDVMEKYVRKITKQENKEAKLLEDQSQISTVDPYEEIKTRHGRQ